MSDLCTRVESTLGNVLNWFTQNRLKINHSKTNLLVVKSKGLRFDEHFKCPLDLNILRHLPPLKSLETGLMPQLEAPDTCHCQALLWYTGGTRKAEPPAAMRCQKGHHRRTSLSTYHSLLNCLGRLHQNPKAQNSESSKFWC